MKIICKEGLNLLLNLPNGNEIIVGDLRFDSREISFEQRISNLYMKSIGFTPYTKGGDYHHYKAECRHNGVYVSHYRSSGNCASVSEGKCLNGLEVIEVDNLLNGFTFIDTAYKDNKVSVNKYEISKVDEEVFEINKVSSFTLYSKDKNLTINRNGVDVKLEEVESFFKGIDDGVYEIFNSMKAFIFNSFVDEKGFLDIYKDFKQFLQQSCNGSSYRNKHLSFSYLYYVGQIKFYYLAEYLIKNNMKDNLKAENPVLTGKPIKDIKEIPVLSKLAMEIKEKYRFDADDTEILLAMEADENIGKEGLKVIYEYLTELNKLNANYESSFRLWNMRRVLASIHNILVTFEITPKNLMNRFVRAMFNENLNIENYASIINDTIEMANALDVELDKKLPREIFRIHDLLKDQIRYIRNKEVEERFGKVVALNSELLDLLPNSDEFTILNPTNPNDLIDEGIRLNHCVGSYIDRYVTGYSKIFFIRRKLSSNEPFVTLELSRNNQYVQASGFSNRKPNKDVMDFVNNWLGNLNK